MAKVKAVFAVKVEEYFLNPLAKHFLIENKLKLTLRSLINVQSLITVQVVTSFYKKFIQLGPWAFPIP